MGYSKEQKANAIELLRKYKTKEVEQKTGISDSTLRRWEKEAGLTVAEAKEQTPKDKKTVNSNDIKSKTTRREIKKQDIRKLEEEVNQHPKCLSEIIRLINTYIHFRKIGEARTLIEKAYDVFPGNIIINNLEVKLENRIRNFKDGKKIAEEILRRNPSDDYAVNSLVAIYIGMEQFDKAEKFILENKYSMRRATKNIMYSRLARMYAEQGKVTQLANIISEFQVVSNESDFNNYMAEGLVYLEFMNGNLEEAERQAEKIPNALNRVYKFIMLGLYDKAQETSELVDKDKLSDVELYGLQARLAAFQGRKAEAQMYVEEAKLAASVEDPYPEHYDMQVDRINHIYSLIKQVKSSPTGLKENKELRTLYQIAKQERDYNILSLFRVNEISFEEEQEKQENLELFEELYASSLYIQGLKSQLDRAKQQGNLEQFRELCHELIRVDPYNVRARERLLLDAIEHSNPDNAKRLTQEILNIDPDNMLVALYKFHSKQPTQNKEVPTIKQQTSQDELLKRVMSILSENEWTPNITAETRKMESINFSELQKLRRKFYDEHDSGLEASIETGKEILAINPTDASIRLKIADDLKIRERIEEAEAIVLEGIGYDKDNYNLVSKMYTFARVKRSVPEMKYWAKRKIEIDPNSINSWVTVFHLAKDWSKEKEDIARRILMLESKNEGYTNKMKQMAQNYLNSIKGDTER